MAKIDYHPSYLHLQAARFDVHDASLRENRLDPKFLYASTRTTELWRAVFLKHSPIHRNPEFARIYREAFKATARAWSTQKVWLIGLGAGTGLKESQLALQLTQANIEVLVSAIDVSYELILETMETMLESPSAVEMGDSLVADVADSAFLQRWLDARGVKSRRLFTFFGLIPNLAPSVVARLFKAVLRPGDAALCSVHLAPVDEKTELPAAMRRVLPQYDNAETWAWIQAALNEWRESDSLERPVMSISEFEGVPAFIANAYWRNGEYAEPYEIFRSLRYTPDLFEETMRRGGFSVERLGMTSCREEGIWSIATAAA